MLSRRKGRIASKFVVAGAVLVVAVLAVSSVSELGPLSTVETGDGCWHKVSINNNTFSSEGELSDYASNKGKSIPGNISFKTINGTLYQEAECIGENQ